eukprot:TRINITY_DN82882_c0_g1_i1.p1 TRINITY_DN82882_c0_g1~~TRINITY_DN82882_c0_g1_i1.p1  ORF type:complete len:629 (-),score=159.01 TRINITY_DN82882_c0_g1_i1:9-1895(-)
MAFSAQAVAALLLFTLAALLPHCGGSATEVQQVEIVSDAEVEAASEEDDRLQSEDEGGDDKDGGSPEEGTDAVSEKANEDEEAAVTTDSGRTNGRVAAEVAPTGVKITSDAEEPNSETEGKDQEEEEQAAEDASDSGGEAPQVREQVRSLPKDYRSRQRELAKLAAQLLDKDEAEKQDKTRRGDDKREQRHAAVLGEGAGVFTSVNPLAAFRLTNIDMWTPWPGLERPVTLSSDCVVLIHYQTATETGGVHLFSRLMIDDSPVKETTSAQGYQKYASTFGLVAVHMKAGYHTIVVQYRTANAGVAVNFPEGGGEWQTLALNVVVLPDAELAVNRPRWQFKLCSNDIWCAWQGFSLEVMAETEMPTMAFYSAVVHGKNELLVSKLMVDGHDWKMTRSVAGNEAYAQNTGIFVATVPPGMHLWDVKYKSKAIDNYFDPGSDWMMRSLTVLMIPDAETYTTSDETNFTTSPGTWGTWKGLSKRLSLVNEHYVLATYSVALESHNDVVNETSVMSVLYVDGVEQKATRSRCGDTQYCSLLGFWVGVLKEGTHYFDVKYKTPAELFLEEGSSISTRALSIVVLPKVASEVRSLLQEGSGELLASLQEETSRPRGSEASRAEPALLRSEEITVF